MFCTKCGNELKDHAKFCWKCGAPVVQPASADADEVAETQEAEAQSQEGQSEDVQSDEGQSDEAQSEETVPLGSDEGEADEATDGLGTEEDVPDVGPKDTTGVMVLVGGDDSESMDATVPLKATVVSDDPSNPTPQPPSAPTVPMEPAQQVAPMPAPVAPAAAAAPAPAKKGKPNTLNIVAIVLVVLAVIAVIAAVAMVVFVNREGAVADEPTDVSRITRIFPTDDDGNKLDDYEVSLVDPQTNQTVGSKSFMGDQGFTVDELSSSGKEVPYGKYIVVIVDRKTGKVIKRYVMYTDTPGTSFAFFYTGGAVKVSEDPTPTPAPAPSPTPIPSSSSSTSTSSSSSTSTSTSSSSSSSSTSNSDTKSQEMNKKYLDKVNEYKKKYGEPSTKSISGGAMNANGLVLAELVDFNNDGKMELLLGYYDKDEAAKKKSKSDLNDPACYHVEVWAYEGSDIKKVFSHVADNSDGGFAFARLHESDNGEHYLSTTTTASGTVTTEAYHYSSGQMKAAPKFVAKGQGSNMKYEIDGASKDKATYDSEYDKVFKNGCKLTVNYQFTSPASKNVTPINDDKTKSLMCDKTIETVKDTVDKLNSDASTGSNEEPAAEAAPEPVSESAAAAAPSGLHVKTDYYEFDLPAELEGQVRIEYPSSSEVSVYGTGLKENKDTPVLSVKMMNADDLKKNGNDAQYSAIGNNGRPAMTVVYRIREETSVPATMASDKDEWVRLHNLCADSAKSTITYKDVDNTR